MELIFYVYTMGICLGISIGSLTQLFLTRLVKKDYLSGYIEGLQFSQQIIKDILELKKCKKK